MTVTINGTTGIAGVDGSAGTPAVQGADTNTGIFFPAADTVGVATGGTERMRVDSSGNVGIGITPNAATKFQTKITTNQVFSIYSGSFVANSVGIAGVNDAYNAYVPLELLGSSIQFGTGGTERMRIDSSGNLLSANGAVYFTSAQYRSNVASSQLQFINNSAGVSLAVNGTSWGSLSDERDKEIIEPITDAISKVASLRSVIGRYKVDDTDKRRTFLIAQDVKAVLPEAVTELEDEQKTLILQYTEVIPLLVSAIQEQQALITALTARIEALEAK